MATKKQKEKRRQKNERVLIDSTDDLNFRFFQILIHLFEDFLTHKSIRLLHNRLAQITWYLLDIDLLYEPFSALESKV